MPLSAVGAPGIHGADDHRRARTGREHAERGGGLRRGDRVGQARAQPERQDVDERLVVDDRRRPAGSRRAIALLRASR